jgi:hypothetical protein
MSCNFVCENNKQYKNQKDRVFVAFPNVIIANNSKNHLWRLAEREFPGFLQKSHKMCKWAERLRKSVAHKQRAAFKTLIF